MKSGFFKSGFLLLSVLCGLTSFAQNLTGIWRGHFNTYQGEQYRFELQIEQTKTNRISGVSYSYLDVRFYGKATLTGSFNKSGKTALIQEIKTVEVKIPGGSVPCIMKLNVTYTRSGKEEFLEGTYSSSHETSDPNGFFKKGDDCGGGRVFLRRVVTSEFYVEPFLRNKITKAPTKTQPVQPESQPKTQPKPTVKKPSVTPSQQSQSKPKPKPNTTVIARDTPAKKTDVVKPHTPKKPNIPVTTRSRENELVKTFTVKSREVIVKFYDNGEIDNDTISVYLDGKPLVMNQRLSAAPITVKITMSNDEPEHTLVMVAENLGRIPPNTSLMVVHDGGNRYQASITSTEQKNAMVRFRYQPNDQ